MISKPLSIGQVARLAEVGVETVRFYERQRLLKEPPHSQSGYRQFAEEVVRRLRFILRAILPLLYAPCREVGSDFENFFWPLPAFRQSSFRIADGEFASVRSLMGGAL